MCVLNLHLIFMFWGEFTASSNYFSQVSGTFWIGVWEYQCERQNSMYIFIIFFTLLFLVGVQPANQLRKY